jgi:D-aminopeptidase
MSTSSQANTPPSRCRARELGLRHWTIAPGVNNAITDVPGVLVGHKTLIDGSGRLLPGVGPVRTGVTVVCPHAGNLFLHKVAAAVHTINGFGKACGFEQIRETGLLESPLALTNTLSVWTVADAIVTHMLAQNPEIGVSTSTVNPVVAECNDGFLNDIRGRHVQTSHVLDALASVRSGPVLEGNVGGGAGMTCFGWKGGIGTASRCLPAAVGGYTLGALVQSNFGRPQDLRIGPLLVGPFLTPPLSAPPPQNQGSVVITLATNAPLDARQLERLCRRAAVALARTGSVLDHGSGDFVIAFSTSRHFPHWPSTIHVPGELLVDEPLIMSHLFPAVVEAVEEAILNSLCMAESMEGRDFHWRAALPLAPIRRMLEALPADSKQEVD